MDDFNWKLVLLSGVVVMLDGCLNVDNLLCDVNGVMVW